MVDEQMLLQLGMVADAGDEALVHTRYCDTEDIDHAAMPLANTRFLQRISLLFGQDKRCLESGCTLHVLKALEKPVILFVKGAHRTIGWGGNVTQQITDKCLDRMRNWCRLAQLVVRAEFPDFELLYSFSIFNLHAPKDKDEGNALSDVKISHGVHFERLARVFEVDQEELRAGYDIVFPVAQLKNTMSHLWRVLKHGSRLVITSVRRGAWRGTL